MKSMIEIEKKRQLIHRYAVTGSTREDALEHDPD